MINPEIDYSNNTNFTNELNNFLAENSKNFVNGERTFNQWTGKHTDSCEYKQRLNLATKPIEYYVNSLNNVSGLPENEEFLSFTPIGNAQQVNIPNLYDRPVPSTLQTTPSVYTFDYLTSPNLGAAHNINTLDTDNDLTLKAGLALRPKNNQADLASKKWPTFGDIHAADLAVTSQNAGQYYPKDLPNVVNSGIPGLNVMPSAESNGVGIMNNPSRFWVSSTVALRNFENGPNFTGNDYKKELMHSLR